MAPPRDGAAANQGRANTDDSANKPSAHGNAGPMMGSTATKIEGSEPVDSGIGRSAPGAAGGAMKGGTGGSAVQ